MLLALAALIQSGLSGTESLPVPFPTPAADAVRSTLVRTERLLAKGDFAGAAFALDSVSLDGLRYSIDLSTLPEPVRKRTQDAVIAGLRLWDIGLANEDTKPNIRIIVSPGFGAIQVVKGVASQLAVLSCQELTWSKESGRHVLTARLFMDEGPEGTAHSDVCLGHLAAKAVGVYMGLAPTGKGADAMCLDDHEARTLPTVGEKDAAYVKAVLAAVQTLRSKVAKKERVTLELPELNVPEVVDFGVTPYGKVSSATVEFKNTGTAPLKITTVIPDCLCVSQKWDREVAPGGTGKIELSIDSAKARGVFTKHLTIKSNDPENADKVVTLHLLVMPAVAVHPGSVSVDLPATGVAEFEAFVYSPTGKPFVVTDVQPIGNRCTATFSPSKQRFAPGDYPNLVVAEREGYRVCVSVPEESRTGMWAGRFRVITDIPGDEGQAIFEARFSRGILVTPNTVHIVVRGEERDRRLVLLEQRSGTFKVLGVEVSEPLVISTIEAMEGGRSFRVWFAPAKDLSPGAHTLRATIRTDSPAQPTISIMILLNVPE